MIVALRYRFWMRLDRMLRGARLQLWLAQFHAQLALLRGLLVQVMCLRVLEVLR